MLIKARLIGPGVDRVWAADDAGGSAAGEGGLALRGVKSASSWLVNALDAAGEKRLAALCIDVDGSSCSWLTAPDASPRVVQTLLNQAATHAEGDGASLVGAAAAAVHVKSETSVQALAVNAPAVRGVKSPAAGGSRGGRGSKPLPDRKRLAVLAMADAPVRVMEDELDKAGYEVRQTLSLWHALCRSWDPGAPAPDAPLESDGDAAIETLPTAVLLVDPDAQRLVWAWSRAGRLISGGVFRLRAIPRAQTNGTTNTLQAPGTSGGGRRFGPGAGGAGGRAGLPDHAVVVGQAEAGRLVLEWLAWSAELGQSPRRVVCIAPPPEGVSVDPLDDPTGLARHEHTLGHAANGTVVQPALSLAELLSRAWPGATIDVGHDPDPLGLTLARLSERVGSSTSKHGESEPDDPRYSLTALSSRACRADRSKMMWAAGALLALAVLVGALGWRVGRASSTAAESVSKAAADRNALLKELEPLIANIMLERNKLDRISNETELLRRGVEDIGEGYPIFLETLRVVSALEGAKDVKVDVLSISTVGSVRLIVPNEQAGPAIFEKLQSIKGDMVWTFSSPPPRNANEPRRVNFQGQWPERRAGSSATGAHP